MGTSCKSKNTGTSIFEHTENCRFNNAELSIFAKFLHYARNNNSDYIDEINKAWIDYTPTISDKCKK